MSGQPGIVVHERRVHQRLVGLAEHRVVEAEPGREAPEYLRVRQRLADPGDDRVRSLQMAMPIGAVDVGKLEMARSRQHDVAVPHRIRHHHIGARDEYILPGERPAHAVLVGMGRDWIVVVDEDRLDRRFQRIVEQQPRDVDDIDRPRAVGHEVRALQAGGGSGKRMAGLGEHAGAEAAVIAGERLERHGGAQTGTAAAPAFDPVADGHPDRLRIAIPVREDVESGAVDATDFGHHVR